MVNKHQYVETAAMTASFFAIVLMIVVLQQRFGTGSGTVIGPSVVALGLVPFLFYLVATGRLEQFHGAGFEVVLRRQANRALAGIGDEGIEVVEEEMKMKDRLVALDDVDEENRPTTLAFEIGREDFYKRWVIDQYLQGLSEDLRYILFIDDDGRFEGFMHLDDFETARETTDSIVDEIETGDVLARPTVNTSSVPNDSSNKAALQEMDRRRVNEVAVLDPNDRFVGVVTQEELVRKLLTDAIQEV